MNWGEQPATWKQLRFLSRCGYKPDHRLTRVEASRLVAQFGGPLSPDDEEMEKVLEEKVNAYRLRMEVEHARGVVAEASRTGVAPLVSQAELSSALIRRQEFWLDTCRGATRLKSTCAEVLELYRKHGCLFAEPTHKQVQDILDALDSAMPTWDKDHLELFYQALGLNFPELLKQPGLKN